MISVIIPVYNSGRILAKCLESFLAQTCNEHEIIAVDDKSSDNSLEILRNYVDKFQNRNVSLKIIEHDKNKGAQVARNTGFKNSKGDYLFFCDSDTVLEPMALSDLTDAIVRNEKIGYVYSSFYWGNKFFRVGEFSEEKLKKGPFIHTNSLIRRSAFPENGWDESIQRLQDWDLWLTILENGYRGYWVDKALFKIKPGGTMSGWLPSVFYKIFPFLPGVKRYKKAVEIIKQKHGLL